MTYFVYKITNKIDGKSYIGSSKEPKKRFHNHITDESKNSLIHQAIKLHGEDNFSFEIIASSKTLLEVAILEFDLINQHNSLHPNGYNYRHFSTFPKSGIRKPMVKGPSKPCKIEGCVRPHRAKGFCLNHYNSAKHFGDLPIAVKRVIIPCEVDGCDNISEVSKPYRYCKLHDTRYRRHGDPLITKNPNHGKYKNNQELHHLWEAMMRRCYNEKHIHYKNYGGRGIIVAERWHDPLNFIADMAPRPKGLKLERIDNDLPYSKDNCKWATNAEQARNRRNNVIDLNLAKHIKTMLMWDFPVTSVSEYWDVPYFCVYDIAKGKTWRNI